MNKKIKKLLAVLAMAFCVLTSSVTPVFAYVDPTWEESAETQETDAPEEEAAEETEMAEESPTETEPESAFTTPGNGDLGDEITSGMKDFYTIHTKNNNTFYLVIDHSGSTDNVYMLSLIDEADLAEFLETSSAEPETESQVVVVPETTQEPETEPVVTQEMEKTEEGTSSSFVTLIVLAVIGVGAALYYFKIYKPKKSADAWASEGMETDDGLDTENEDKDEL